MRFHFCLFDMHCSTIILEGHLLMNGKVILCGKVPSPVYVYTSQQKLGRGVWPRKTGLFLPVIYYGPFQDNASVVFFFCVFFFFFFFFFILFVSVCPRLSVHFVYDSPLKELSSWLSACAV